MSFKPKQLQLSAVCVFALIVLFSCHNRGNDAGGGNPVNNSYLRSSYTLAPGSVLIDSFTYDDQKKIATYAQYITQGSNSAYASFDFHFSGGNTLPDSYVYDDNGSSQLTHQLTFDGQGRIVEDTCADTHFVTHYVYSGNYIICTVESDGTMNDATIDSLLITDGNIAAEKIWQSDNGVWGRQGDVTYARVTAANPGYKAEIAGSIGPLLYILSVYNYGGWGDYISKSMMNKVTGTAEGLPPGGFNYSVKTDAQGRVSGLIPTGFGVPSGVGQYFNYY